MPVKRSKKRSKYEEGLPPHVLAQLDDLRKNPPTEDEIRRATTFSEVDLDLVQLREDTKDQVRVVLPMAAWAELESLVDDSTDEETDLPTG